MRSKRLLTMLLAVAMIFSLMTPAASAVKPGENTGMNPAESIENMNAASKNEASPFDNSLIASDDTAENGLKNLKDDPKLTVDVQEVEMEKGDGTWSSTKVDADVDLTISEVPECIAELQEAAELYSKNEKVVAFVVMEQAPLAETYNSISRVAPETEAQMLAVQNKVIDKIEKQIIGGAELDVRYQFTYLTNSFSIETEFENLERIARMDGVKSVFVMPVYEPCAVDTMDPLTASSANMTGVSTVWNETGFTGAGMKIAVIDTGLDLDHPSFEADPELTDSSMTREDIDDVLEDLNAYALRSTITAETLYRSAKVPYAFNYVDASLTADHSNDMQGDHGTHVAGIAAANATEGTTVVGMAPDAQIIVMKVFGANGGAYTDDIVAALEDAMTLGCDVVNASLGSPRGFSSSDTEIDLIYERLASQDIIATISAGNEGTSSYANMWGTNLNRTQNPDNATVGSPSTYVNVFSIASAENGEVQTPYFALADGTKVFFNMSYEYAIGEAVPSMAELIDWELEYVIIDGLGNEEDFYDAEGNSLVEGKVAVVRRGTLNFGTKIHNAELAGAVCCVIWNNVSEDIFNSYMNTTLDDGSYPMIPCCEITLESGQVMADAEVKTMTVAEETAARQCAGGQMSSFSSWGVAPDLRLLPDITGIGGNVYSCYDGGIYGVMSGTSMSAPQIAGVSALVMQYLYTVYPDAPDGSIRELAMALMMSTADPIISTGSGVEASPRQQGAGLVDAYEAVTTEAYLTVGGNRPKAELGDSSTGKYSFSFEIHNFSDAAKTYTLDASLLTEDVAGMQISATEVEYFMYGENISLDGTVTFDKSEVTVPAGGTANVTVTIELSESDKAYFAEAWENGGYVEGYVYLFNEEGEAELNLPFLGFYGDWTEAPIFDTAYWYDNSFWSVAPADGLPEGDEFYNVIWTSLAGTDWVLGMNPYSGAVMGADGSIVYDPAHNVLSPNGDGVLDGIAEIYLSLLRNAKTLTFTYTDAATGEELHRETITNNPKTMFISSYGQVVPWMYSWYGYGMYDFAGLESGTQVLMTIDATIDYENGGDHSIQIPITIDTTAPELVNTYEVAMNGSYYLVVEAKDETAMASVVLMNPAGTQYYAQAYDVTMEETEEGTMLAYFDITGLGTEFLVAVCDYACNEAYFEVTYEAADGNLPVMDADQLYAYRVFDDAIYSDHMYGWVSLNKPASAEETAYVSAWTDDYLEYAAINAAEYVDGKIFAVDAVYNLVVMEPGLFNRNTIRNLGVNVIDMTFDDSTDTMYVLSKQGNYMYLYSLDLLTGELTQLKNYGYYTTSAPYAIADDDNGTIYAIKYNSANLYTLDEEFALQQIVLDVDGVETPVVITDSDGYTVGPNYAQGLTYADGKLYWAYFKNYYNFYLYADLITIDTTDWTFYASDYEAQAYDANNQLVTYNPYTELVGLITLTETDYQIPASDAITGLLLSDERVLMTVGQTATVTATPVPWNYEVQSLTWSSSDEDVATVVNGRVTAVGEGTATLTVIADGMEQTCQVTVVNTDTSFYAYNYYSADGNFGYIVDVDTGSMTYSPVAEAPVDFMAADYNGHDGYYYGYTEGGQFWRTDLETGEAVKLGDPIGTAPVDMAYDYSTGFMYAAVTDQMSYSSYIAKVNMKTGALEPVAGLESFGLITLACDGEGNLYTVNAYGELYKYTMENGYPTDMAMIMDGLGDVFYMQSMCWDHENDVLLWAYCEASTVVWIDPNADEPYAVMLGDPTGSGMFEFVGMFTEPETLMELPDVAVEDVYAEDMMMLVGATKTPNITVYPFNASNQDLVLTSSDETILKINADGTMTGVAEGQVTVNVSLTDGEEVYEASFQVSVLQGADDIYGMVLTDLASMGGQYWVRIYAQDPSDPDMMEYIEYIIYAEEYYDGKLYAVGYDPNDWSGNWQMFVMDPKNHKVLSQSDLGEAYPFVYDMTYDYTTSTMYAVAGPSDNDSSLYVFDMETGELTLLMDTDQFFMSLAAGPDGILYAMENSKEVINDDFWDPWAPVEYSNAMLYAIDPIEGTIELIGDTGVKCNMLASMSYDYDTDRLYWTPLYQGSSNISGLHIVDPETAAAVNLGAVGMVGAQISGLYIICDNFPEENNNELLKVIVAPEKVSVVAGATTDVKAILLPGTLDADIVWTSSDSAVATVDADGVVTGVAQGKAVITATVTHNGVTMSDTCAVGVMAEDAAFLTYNITDGGWSEISRLDATVTNLTEAVEETPVVAIEAIDDVVYGFDAENNFFSVADESFEREVIGAADSADAVAGWLSFFGYSEEEIAAEADYYKLEIRDLAYDEANDRMLVLGAVVDVEYGSEMNYGDAIYQVNLETGALTELYRFIDIYNVMALTVDDNGIIYYYNAYNDYYTALDLTTGATRDLISGQSQSLYGSTENSHALYFDGITGMIYHLFTSNGNAYRMIAVDPSTGILNLVYEYVGEVVYDDESWADIGDSFAGLTMIEEEAPEVEDPTEPEETDPTTPSEPEETKPTEPEVPEKPFPFTDVPDWARTAVNYLFQKGIVAGMSETLFGSNANVTRAQAVLMIWRYAGSPEAEGKNAFTDVKAGAYYEDAVTWAAENEIVAGVGENKFAPNDALTREQLVVILRKVAIMEGRDVSMSESIASFKDAGRVSSWAREAMEWAVANDMISGNPDGTLAPKANATRAEFAQILYKFIIAED